MDEQHLSLAAAPLCNLYRLTTNVEAIRRLFAVTGASRFANLSDFPEIYPNRDAPVIRARAEGGREVAIMRWGFPPPQAAARPVTNVRNLASHSGAPRSPGRTGAARARDGVLRMGGRGRIKAQGLVRNAGRRTVCFCWRMATNARGRPHGVPHLRAERDRRRRSPQGHARGARTR
jgi:hypothetical protein